MGIDLEKLLAAIHARTPSWVRNVRVTEMTDAEGEPALRVTLVIDAPPGLLHDGKELETAVEAVHAALRQLEVDRWPYTRFVSTDEAA
ncbi:MAG: hypothetical protein KF901_17985 [Myxococcales bacterium]|nr:hypothetical protein [Myxococcales bacterium]